MSSLKTVILLLRKPYLKIINSAVFHLFVFLNFNLIIIWALPGRIDYKFYRSQHIQRIPVRLVMFSAILETSRCQLIWKFENHQLCRIWSKLNVPVRPEGSTLPRLEFLTTPKINFSLARSEPPRNIFLAITSPFAPSRHVKRALGIFPLCSLIEIKSAAISSSDFFQTRRLIGRENSEGKLIFVTSASNRAGDNRKFEPPVRREKLPRSPPPQKSPPLARRAPTPRSFIYLYIFFGVRGGGGGVGSGCDAWRRSFAHYFIVSAVSRQPTIRFGRSHDDTRRPETETRPWIKRSFSWGTATPKVRRSCGGFFFYNFRTAPTSARSSRHAREFGRVGVRFESLATSGSKSNFIISTPMRRVQDL